MCLPAAEVTRSLANRLFGDKGPEFQHLVGSTIRSVTFGILGVAVIQSLFAVLGFVVAGLPGAGLWSVIFLLAAVLQMGGLVLVPAVIYVFATGNTTKAVIFLIWCIIVGLMDNVLKPVRSVDLWPWASSGSLLARSSCQWAISCFLPGWPELRPKMC